MRNTITVDVNFPDNHVFTLFKKDMTEWIAAWFDTHAKKVHARELATKLTAEQTKIRASCASFIGQQVTDDMRAGSLTPNVLCEFITNSCVDKVKHLSYLAALSRSIHFCVNVCKFETIGKLVANILRKESRRGALYPIDVDKLAGYLTAHHNAAVAIDATYTQPSDVAAQIGKRVTELFAADMEEILSFVEHRHSMVADVVSDILTELIDRDQSPPQSTTPLGGSGYL